MKKIIVPFLFFFFALGFKSFSQTVYVNQTGSTYHRKTCKLYTPNFEAVPLWKAKGPLSKRPCPKCKPPVNETGAGTTKKKPAAKPKAKAKPASSK